MSERALISTRKGLFELQRSGQGWSLGTVHFLGEPVSFALADVDSLQALRRCVDRVQKALAGRSGPTPQ